MGKYLTISNLTHLLFSTVIFVDLESVPLKVFFTKKLYPTSSLSVNCNVGIIPNVNNDFFRFSFLM